MTVSTPAPVALLIATVSQLYTSPKSTEKLGPYYFLSGFVCLRGSHIVLWCRFAEPTYNSDLHLGLVNSVLGWRAYGYELPGETRALQPKNQHAVKKYNDFRDRR
jgi:hypothetical protein